MHNNRPVRVLMEFDTQKTTCGEKVHYEVSVQKTDGGARVMFREVFPNKVEKSYFYHWSVNKPAQLFKDETSEDLPDQATVRFGREGFMNDIVRLLWND